MHMKKTEFVTLLNGDLASEYQSIVQYVQHIALLSGPEAQALTDELRAHLTQELTHATTLAEQIDFLDGTPTVTVPDVPAAPASRETEDILALDLDLETRQLDRYRERSQQAAELSLPDVAEALRPLLQQTQEHVRDLRAALGD
jgi:bacterioferritin